MSTKHNNNVGVFKDNGRNDPNNWIRHLGWGPTQWQCHIAKMCHQDLLLIQLLAGQLEAHSMNSRN